jgi:hypothetical protein
MSMKNFNDTIGNRSRDIPVCSAGTFYGVYIIYKCGREALGGTMLETDAVVKIGQNHQISVVGKLILLRTVPKPFYLPTSLLTSTA